MSGIPSLGGSPKKMPLYGMTWQWIKKQLQQTGLRSMQTFDLHTVRVGLHDCSCQNHETDECDCQMMVLLAYGKFAEPATLILYGNDGQTWFSIVDNPQLKADANLIAAIHQTLETKPSICVSQDI